MSIPISNKTLLTLSFAHDQVIFAQDSYGMKFVLQRFYREYMKWSLYINLEKSEYVVINLAARFPIFVTDTITQVDKYKRKD